MVSGVCLWVLVDASLKQLPIHTPQDFLLASGGCGCQTEKKINRMRSPQIEAREFTENSCGGCTGSMNKLNRLRADAARERQAKRPGAPTLPVAPAPPNSSKRALAMQKADGDHQAHQANVDTYFSKLVEEVPIEERGSVKVDRDVPWFNEAAHKWGLLRITADEQVRRDTASTSTILPGAIPKLNPEQQRPIYKRGYVLWYLVGRPKPKLEQSHAEGFLIELADYTATINPPNPEGSRAERFRDRLVLLSQLLMYGSQAYSHHLERAPPPRNPGNPGNPSNPTKRPLEEEPASGSAARAIVPRRPVPQAAAPPLPPQLPPPPPPLPLAKAADVGMRFLQTPEAHHTFRASNFAAIRLQVAHQLSTDRVFEVSPLSLDVGGIRSQDYKLSNGKQANGEILYRTLRDDYYIDTLFLGLGPVVDIRNATSWPESFRGLGLALVARGSYNSVWRLARGENGTNPSPPEALRAILPYHVVEGLVQDVYVLRIPNADQWSTYAEVLLETVNISEAALGRYGPNVAAMWVGRESKPEMPGTGQTQGRFKLFAILERGTDVHMRISQMVLEQPRPSRAIWSRYLQSLRRCVWRFSANRCLHLDGKLANFIDNFPASGVAVDDKNSTIKAIDLASDFYRRIERLTQAESTSATSATSPDMAQGWKLVWLYNVLFVTCSLRLVLPVDVYTQVWWPSISKAAKSILRECVSERSLPNKDPEYLRARSFLMQCRWKGGFLMSARPQKPPDGDDPSSLSATALGTVRHYFHDIWYNEAVRRLIEPARAVRLANSQNGTSPQDVAHRESLRQKRNQSWTWYNTVFRPRALPMIRFFSDKMEYEHDQRALPMIQVLCDYADASEEDLYPLTAGATHPMKPNQIVRWPKARLTFDEQWLNTAQWENSRSAAREIGFR